MTDNQYFRANKIVYPVMLLVWFGIFFNEIFRLISEPVGIECEICGASIRTGRFCEACKKNVSDGFRKSIAPPKPLVDPNEKKRMRDSDKMRFLQ